MIKRNEITHFNDGVKEFVSLDLLNSLSSFDKILTFKLISATSSESSEEISFFDVHLKRANRFYLLVALRLCC